ncbi:MAG: agmatinase [Pseudomonadota bacterium]
MSDGLDYLSPGAGFLEADRPGADAPEDARAVVIPFGLEASVSYGGGTAKGPAAILAASEQLELYDEELHCTPSAVAGIATLAEPQIAPGQASALDQIEALVRQVADAGRFPIVLGGEHALTPGAIRPFVRDGEPLVILQIDAHADLRDGYLGEHFSHASAMRRVLDLPDITVVSVGIRAISEGEVAFYDANRDRVVIHWAKDMANWSVPEIVVPMRGKRLYITFDIDGLDSAVMPATGTPTPGGLGFWQAMGICRAACEAASEVVGADVVELAPIDGLHACDYTAALVAHKLIAYARCQPAR